MKKILFNESESNLIDFFLYKNRLNLNLVKDILNIIFNIKYINFSYINLINSLNIKISIENNEKFIRICNDSNIEIVFYSKNKLGKFSTNYINLDNIIKNFNKYTNYIKYLSEEKDLNIPDYNSSCSNNKNLKLFHPFKDKLNNKLNILKFIKNNILNLSNNDFININDINFNTSYKNIIFGNTFNILKNYNKSYHCISCQITSKKDNKNNQKFDFINSRSTNILNNINNFGLKCAKESFLELNPIKIKSLSSKIIIRNDVATNIFNNFSKAIDGKYIYLKLSYLTNYINKLIFPYWMNIIEIPNIIKGLGSLPFDKEGIKPKKKFIVKDGILKNLISNTYYSNKLKIKNFGNANGIYNWIFNIKHKKISFDSLLLEMYNGILVTNILGNGLNIFTGDYSQGVSGFMVKNGKIIYPVNEIIISGNMINIFKNIIFMSEDIEKRNVISCGSILINDIKISGI